MEKEKWENQEGESDDDSENDLDYQPDRKKYFTTTMLTLESVSK